MPIFYVCKCGFPKNNHEFRHVYEPVIKVKQDMNTFTLNSNDYPDETKMKCSKCTLPASLHTGQVYQPGTPDEVVQHDYSPLEIKYHRINFTVPLETICSCCKLSLNDHKDVQTHSFTLKLIVKNKTENDVIVLNHPDDEDVKILISS